MVYGTRTRNFSFSGGGGGAAFLFQFSFGYFGGVFNKTIIPLALMRWL